MPLRDEAFEELLDLAHAAEARLAHGDRAGPALLLECANAAASDDALALERTARAFRVVEARRLSRIEAVRAGD